MITITRKHQAIFQKKDLGLSVWYYLFPEYEIHYNEQDSGVEQEWHAHEKVQESLFIIEGVLTVRWRENDQIKENILYAGDLVEVGQEMHSFINKGDVPVKLLVLKRIPTHINYRDTFKSDKVRLS